MDWSNYIEYKYVHKVLNKAPDCMGLIDKKKVNYMFISGTQGHSSFSMMNQILGDKIEYNKFVKI